MSVLGQRDFSAGWCPSEDAVNGKRNSLLRMDNLQLDEGGIVSITKAFTKISNAFSNAPIRAFSKILNGQVHRYVGNGTIVSKSVNKSLSYSTNVLTGGSTNNYAFGSGMGYALIASGTKKKKDDGTTILDLGIDKPATAPILTAGNSITKLATSAPANFTMLEGDGFQTLGFLAFLTSSSSGVAVVQANETIDLTDFNGTGNDSPNDTFNFTIRLGDPNTIRRIRFIYSLDTLPADTNTELTNYYFVEYQGNDPLLNPGSGGWSVVNSKRSQFTKVGSNTALNWADVKGIRIIVDGSFLTPIVSTTVWIANIFFNGGDGLLSGNYKYVQVDLFNNGRHWGISPVSDFSTAINVNNQGVKIQPTVPPTLGTNVTHIAIYRRNLDIGDRYYLVALRTDTSEFTDNLSDQQAINDELNIAPIPDLRIANFFIVEPPDDILAIAGPYYDRFFYMTANDIYVSLRGTPDSCDSRFTMSPSGEDAEVNFWLQQIGDSALILGTSQNIYEIAGSGEVSPEGLIDFTLRPRNIYPPPISRAHTVYNTTVIYFANDGWRIIDGYSSQLIVKDTHLLYNNEIRYGISPVFITGFNQVNYDCCVSKGKLFTTVTNQNLGRRCYIYDFAKDYWYPYFTNPVSLFTEEDGTIIACYGGQDDFFLRQLDTGTLNDSFDKQNIFLQTVFYDNDEPNRRKDLEVLEVFADTGDSLVEVLLAKDGVQTYYSLGTTQFNGPSIKQFKLQNTELNLAKSLSLMIKDDDCNGVNDFKFYYFTVRNEHRPEQKSHIHISPTNFGVAGRKRFYDVPVSIDSLGNDFRIDSVIEGAVVETSFFIGDSQGKKLRTIAYRNEIIGHEVGLEIYTESNDKVLELYEIVKPRNLEVLPDSGRFFRIPYNNLGTSARKRFVRLALVLDTRGNEVTFTPLVDSGSFVSTQFNTTRKQTVFYYFNENIEGIDIGGILDIVGDGLFEFYGINEQESVFEVLPTPSTFLRGSTDFGTAARKRFSRLSFVINPRGGTITFRPIVDGVTKALQTFNGNRRETLSYYFSTDEKFVDLEYEIDSTTTPPTPFEFYKILQPERIEVLPEPVRYFRLPTFNQGSHSRKRWHLFAFMIDTFGMDVTFTPIVNNVARTSSIVNTTGPTVYRHHFLEETVGVELSGELLGAEKFEFYQIIEDQTITERLPSLTRLLILPKTNYGLPSKKRIRTIPIVINTFGNDITFLPFVDGVQKDPTTLNTNGKETAFHYFEEDIFGTDFSANLSAPQEFEFYEFPAPENVEALPVSKKWDQLGPIDIVQMSWLRAVYVTLVCTGQLMTYRVFCEDVQFTSGSFQTFPDRERTYDIQMQKGVKGNNIRIELESQDSFHRIGAQLRIAKGGDSTDLKIIRLGDKNQYV